MSQLIKLFDEDLKRYRQLNQKIRYILRTGLNDKNSYNFYIYVDEIKSLYEQLKRRYNMKPRNDIDAIIEAYG